MNNSPIGIFDSGIGGLSVWSELRMRLPDESIIYYGEGKNCPFGNKTRAEITEYTDFAVRRLLDKGVKLVVIACNAATTAAIDYLRATYDIPFVGLEPAVKPAVETTKTGVVGVLATKATLDGRHFKASLEKYKDKAKIIAREGKGFVELVEEGRELTPEAYKTVYEAIKPIMEAGADRIVLGCTHYPFLETVIQQVTDYNDGIQILDPAGAIEKRVEFLLREHGIEAAPDNKSVREFMTSGGDDYLQKLIRKSNSLNL